MIPEDEMLKMVKYATKAPSGHNTQPWKFKVESDNITIIPDFTRALPAVDSDNHALYISLGCALENLRIAAPVFGYDTKIEFKYIENELNIKVTFLGSTENVHSDLFSFIEKRQVTRNEFQSEKLKPEVLAELFDDILEEGVHLKLFTSDKEIRTLTPFIIEGSNLQFNNKAFVNELVSWCRFSEKEVLIKGDGLWSASMGLPNIGRFVGSFIMKNLVSAKSEAKRWNKIIKKTGGFVLFMVEKNDCNNWIKLGQVFQRFGLKATKLNIRHAHANMPCEEQAIREKMIKTFELNNLTPLLLIRFGYSNPLPYSYRRKLSDVIV
ncbi:MAG: hypothetical protein P1P88_04170 [Bacteroidales bacterium]|nr:hypothetical protein [Bacteroidales bacterium]